MSDGPNEESISEDLRRRKDAVQAALEAMLATLGPEEGPCWEDHDHEPGDICTSRPLARPASWVFVVEWVDVESGDYRYMRFNNHGLPEHSRIGLIEIAREMS